MATAASKPFGCNTGFSVFSDLDTAVGVRSLPEPTLWAWDQFKHTI